MCTTMPDEIADLLSFALRCQGRKRANHADDVMARIQTAVVLTDISPTTLRWRRVKASVRFPDAPASPVPRLSVSRQVSIRNAMTPAISSGNQIHRLGAGECQEGGSKNGKSDDRSAMH
jgi:hypothetical protein